jgi:hypothetical protein
MAPLARREIVTNTVWRNISGPPFSHFSALVHYIEQMIVTGREPYPPERTLLTTGALAALMESSETRSRPPTSR